MTHAAMPVDAATTMYQQRAAADRDQIGMAVDVKAVDMRMDFGDVEVGVLGALAALDDNGRADQPQARGTDFSEVGVPTSRGQTRLSLNQ